MYFPTLVRRAHEVTAVREFLELQELSNDVTPCLRAPGA